MSSFRSLRGVVLKLLGLKTRVVGSVPGFSGLSYDTLSRGQTADNAIL